MIGISHLCTHKHSQSHTLSVRQCFQMKAYEVDVCVSVFISSSFMCRAGQVACVEASDCNATQTSRSHIAVSLLPLLQDETSAQAGSPSSTLTCSSASPCSESPSSTLSAVAGGRPSPLPLPSPSPHCSSSSSISGTLSSPAPCPAPGPLPGPPSQSPTSTLESKDSGIIGERCCSFICLESVAVYLHLGSD